MRGRERLRQDRQAAGAGGGEADDDGDGDVEVGGLTGGRQKNEPTDRVGKSRGEGGLKESGLKSSVNGFDSSWPF